MNKKNNFIKYFQFPSAWWIASNWRDRPKISHFIIKIRNIMKYFIIFMKFTFTPWFIASECKDKINLSNLSNSQAVISRWYLNSSFGFLWYICRRNCNYDASYFSYRFLWPHCRWSWNVNTFIPSNCFYLDLFAPIFYQCLWLAKEWYQLGAYFWA